MQCVTVAPHLRACCNNSSFLCFSINCLSSADLEKRLPRTSMLSGSGAAGSDAPLGPGWSSELVFAWEGARSAACRGSTAMTTMTRDTAVSYVEVSSKRKSTANWEGGPRHKRKVVGHVELWIHLYFLNLVRIDQPID